MMLAYDEAMKLVREASRQLPVALCEVQNALGRVLSAPVMAEADLPAFDNSAMDGFALQASSSIGKNAAGLTLPVTGTIAAGDVQHHARQTGSKTGAVEIMTGASVPGWCDTVVPIEQVEVTRDENGNPVQITLQGPVPVNRHIRRAGEDIRKNDTVLGAGTTIRAEEIMMLSALGTSKVSVRTQPRISLISTGAELVDDPAMQLQPGQIRNSNQPYLAAALHDWPVKVEQIAGHPDDRDRFLKLLQAAEKQGTDMVISTGAVSMGARDFVPEALQKAGAKMLFHKCRIRPGKPVLVARLASGSLFFGLPGNPVSAAVGLHFFVLPCLRNMLAIQDANYPKAILRGDFSKKPGFRMFAKARAYLEAEQLCVQVLAGQQSFRMGPLLDANCWVIFEEEQAEYLDGDKVHLAWFSATGARI